MSEPEIVFRTRDGQDMSTTLAEFEDDGEGMPEGLQTPAPGTRYAPPLSIVYRPSDPTVVLATVDAREWAADSHTAPRAIAMIIGGLAVTLFAMGWLTRDARRRGLTWWKWYTDAPAKNPR
ncbi:hypothetical protein [Kribbella amoyensis]|nr:hypothetical protein [Kribbella amoyensis]